MASKLREDLPTKPDRRYTREMIKIFNENRKDYHNEVEKAKKMYGNIAMIVDEDCDTFSGSIKGFMMMAKNQGKHAQLLLKKSPSSMKGDLHAIMLTRNIDVITAFYIPEDIEYFSIDFNGLRLTYTGTPIEIDLEVLLKESLSLPLIPDENFWEVILWKSRQEKYGMAHTQEPIMEIDGIIYKRVIFIQPYFPISCVPFNDATLLLSEKRDIFIEGNLLQNETRCNIEGLKVGWVENKAQGIPLIRVMNGSLGMAYYQDENIKDELEVNKELFDSFSDEKDMDYLKGISQDVIKDGLIQDCPKNYV